MLAKPAIVESTFDKVRFEAVLVLSLHPAIVVNSAGRFKIIVVSCHEAKP